MRLSIRLENEMGFKVAAVYNFLKFCPECGKELEIDPLSGWKACFLHGDFTTTSEIIIWNFTSNLIKREGEQ
jgi:hypothetical protein